MGRFRVLHGQHIDENGVLHQAGTPSETFETKVDLVRRLGPEKFEEILPHNFSGVSSSELRRMADEAEQREKGSTSTATATLEDMTVEELRRYAAEEEIDLGPAKTKADIIKAITK